eukprot:1619524-Karenia_brevis.AAC.1
MVPSNMLPGWDVIHNSWDDFKNLFVFKTSNGCIGDDPLAGLRRRFLPKAVFKQHQNLDGDMEQFLNTCW